MGLRRKILELRRMFKHRWSYFLLFSVSFLGFVLTIGFWQGDFDEGHDHAHVGETKIRLKTKTKKPENQDQIEPPDQSEVLVEFKQGVIGNYEPDPDTVQKQSGPGENGEGVRTDQNSPEVRGANAEFGFNTFASDKISLNRSIPDTRDPECRYWHYPTKLPKASVVIVFHNEGWSPLLRTVHSVLLRSPPELLEEVLLVDDFSVKEHLKSKLEKYIQQFQGKVRLIRTKDREGLIGARTTGAKNARGEVVIFLDAHCEANVNWLPPLLAPIAENSKMMTVPVIDGIDMHTWHYRPQYGYSGGGLYRGIFEWGLLYKEAAIPAQEAKRRHQKSEPFRSPTHAGGLFAISTNWFKKLGYYDPGLKIWGGEQYELSFKIWQCGGGILFVPCSRVGHVYRMRMPYNFGKLKGPIVSTEKCVVIVKNHKRVAEVWMDEYKEYYFIREPFMRKRDHGDISGQLKIREDNKCHTFKWYMENVAYDVPKEYPYLPPNKVWGEAKNLGSDNCLDTMGQPIPGILGVSGCHGFGGNQLFRLNTAGQMASGEWCILIQGKRLQSNRCRKGTADGPWDYIESTKQMIEKEKNNCVTVEKPENILKLAPCRENDPLQKWAWKEIWL